ncbi:MAG: pyridoxamine 5'-phosphate oxidase family protein [Gemmatimonadota bacterium]|nr:pyridoxamine 5'-phosphate oxidase family protein [Gemmatimonadota bacterium]
MRATALMTVAAFFCVIADPMFPPEALSAQQATSNDTLLAAARDIMEASRYAALVTVLESGAPRAREMDPFAPDSQFVVWMGTHRATRKVRDLERDPRVLLYYQDPTGAGYVTIEGTARLVDDTAETAHRWKDEWAEFYPDRAATYLLIAVTPSRLEVVNYRRGVVGDSATWRVPAVEFDRQ